MLTGIFNQTEVRMTVQHNPKLSQGGSTDRLLEYASLTHFTRGCIKCPEQVCLNSSFAHLIKHEDIINMEEVITNKVGWKSFVR